MTGRETDCWLDDRGREADCWLDDRGREADCWLDDRGRETDCWLDDRGREASRLSQAAGAPLQDALAVLDRVLPHVRCLGVQRAVVVGLSQQALYAEQQSSDIIRGRPLLLEYIKADVALLVDIGVEAGRCEPHQRRRERVLGGELEAQLELESLVDGAGGARDGGHPVEEVVTVGEGRDALVARGHQCHQLSL